jgi:hypothetical protein
MAWSDIFLDVFKKNDVRFISYVNSHWVRDGSHFDELISRPFDNGGPVLLAVKIDDKPGAAQTVRDPALIRSCFMKDLAPAAAARSTLSTDARRRAADDRQQVGSQARR